MDRREHGIKGVHAWHQHICLCWQQWKTDLDQNQILKTSGCIAECALIKPRFMPGTNQLKMWEQTL